MFFADPETAAPLVVSRCRRKTLHLRIMMFRLWLRGEAERFDAWTEVKFCLPAPEGIGGTAALHVEEEVHHVAVLDDIVLAFYFM